MPIIDKTKQIIIQDFEDVRIGNFFILNDILYLKTNKTSAFDFHNNIEYKIEPCESCRAKVMDIIINY